jgi:hypothetical protein
MSTRCIDRASTGRAIATRTIRRRCQPRSRGGSRFASIGRDYLACSGAWGSGTCSNRKSIRRSTLEDTILGALKTQLMAPELVQEVVSAVNAEINKQRRDDGALVSAKEQELAGVRRKLTGLIKAISEGLRGPDLQSRLDELATRRDPAGSCHPRRGYDHPAESYRKGGGPRRSGGPAGNRVGG